MRMIPISPSHILAVFVTLLLSSVSLYSQVIYGSITDPDGLPVTGADVVILGTQHQTKSDDLGSYSLIDAPVGSNTVIALSDNFEAVELQVDVDGEASTRTDIRFREIRKSATTVEVVGESADALAEIPGSVGLISLEELAASRPVDANEVLRRVPGVTLREDSGPVGTRLNVGMRGLNPDRSRKVLMMEDGIPIALAPYGEPDMYYAPPIDRMRRVEVLKGSGQIVHGPQTVGGVINFVTPDPPPSTHGSAEVEGGQNGSFRGQATVGSSTRDQSKGWLINYLHKRGDGFRGLWWDVNDTLGKFVLKPDEKHTIGMKFGFYDERSNSTYLGLTLPQWTQDPQINSVPHDTLAVRRYSGSVNHTMVLSPNAVWNSSFYGYDTVRNWGRQDWDRTDKGRDYLSIEGDPSIPGGAIYLRDSAGNRNRNFRVFGGQSGVSWHHGLGRYRGNLDVGMRYLSENAEDQRVNGPGYDAREGRIRDGEFRNGTALSGYVQERIHIGDRLIITPGVRLEHYSYVRDIYRRGYEDVSTIGRDSITTAIPGLGLSAKAHENVTFFAGLHRGFSPPRTKIAVTSDGESLDLDPELSWNYEVGVRLNKSRLLSGEVTFFRLDFQNQIITAAESGGATTTLVNGGETLNQGVEASARMNWNELVGSSWLIYTDTRYMYLPKAQFTRNAMFAGNRLPYAPRHTFGFLLGIRQREGFGFQVDTAYTASQFGDNRETVETSNDGAVGLLPSFQLWNLMVDYTIRREHYEVIPYFAIKNFADLSYVASRAPQGIQPGWPRQTNVGLRFVF